MTGAEMPTRTGTVTLADTAARDRISGSTAETLFVAAGAGAGKTTALVSRILTLVLDDGVPIERIAAVTFTDRAAEDLRGKIRVALEHEVSRAAGERAARAGSALAALDLAPIGTLHSFAQRILSQHAIEAGIPPAVQVSDQMAGAIAAQQRWSRLREEMLQDPDAWLLYEAALATGLTERHLRALVGCLDADSDLIADRFLRTAPRTPLPPVPLLAPIRRRVQDIAALLTECTDGGDRLAVRIGELQVWADACPLPTGPGGQGDPEGTAVDGLAPAIGWLTRCPSTAVGNVGAKGNWPRGVPVGSVRADVIAVGEEVRAQLTDLQDGVLRRLAAWFGQRLLLAAEERRRSGRLEFHDLLVGARDLLRRSPGARAALHDRYPHLLLDEFQDTDPLQIEIAVRIAGGADAADPDWRRIPVPPGALFVVGDPKQSIYRFRRADIGLYLEAGAVLGGNVSLTTNFRSSRPLIEWINGVFSQVIVPAAGLQPAFEPLAPFRDGVDPGRGGPPVAILGAEAHPLIDGKAISADRNRELEAADIARVIHLALDEGWLVTEQRRGPDGKPEEVQRPVRLGDITLLVPGRTSLEELETALDAAGLGYRTEVASLVLTDPDVLALRAAARAVADPTDQFTLVTALRSPQFGCGDDDLWTWKRDGGGFDLRPDPPERLRDHPVAHAMDGLRALHRQAFRLSPSEVLQRIIRERRMMEIAATTPRARERIRRLRYVVEQARAWSEATHGGLRAFLDWLDDQAEDSQQSAESVLPETDTDGIRITTIHASKGLDFPVVIMAGLGGQPGGRKELRVLWGRGSEPAEIVAKDALATAGGKEADALEKNAAAAERARVLYVAATRARDHLIVSLHRPVKGSRSSPAELTRTSAQWLVDAGALGHGAVLLSPPEASEVGGEHRAPAITVPAPLPREDWERRIRSAQERSRRPWSASASTLEGAGGTASSGVVGPAPSDVAAGSPSAPPAPTAEDPVLDRATGIDDPAPGDGALIGSAVHAVLQTAPFRARPTGDPTEDAGRGEDGAAVGGPASWAASARAHCAAFGIPDQEAHVTALVRAALAHPLLIGAASAPRHWREMYVGAPADGAPHRVRDGIIDLLIEEADGTLTIVDYKTDREPVAGLDARTAHYAPQLREYRRLVAQATGRTVGRAVLLFLADDGAREREVPLG